MLPQLAKRMITETDKRLLWKFAYNFGYKGMRSVQRYKKRLKRGVHFPPFLFISIDQQLPTPLPRLLGRCGVAARNDRVGRSEPGD